MPKVGLSGGGVGRVGLGGGRGRRIATDIPVNTALPVISGIETRGETLSASAGAWDQPYTSAAYQWYRDAVAIGGATANTYTLQAADVGTDITVGVEVTNTFGTSAEAVSTATGPIADFLVITGTPDTTAAVGVPYGWTPATSGGHTPYNFTADTAMPSGWSLNASTGEVTGTPVGAGTADIPDITVTDADDLQDTLPGWTITISEVVGQLRWDIPANTGLLYALRQA